MALDTGLRHVWAGLQLLSGGSSWNAPGGTLNEPTYTRLMKCLNFKFTPRVNYITPEEYGPDFQVEFDAVQGTKFGEFDITVGAHYDDLGMFLYNMAGTPTRTAVGSHSTSDSYTLTFGGSWVNAETFTLTIDGVTSGNIAYNSVASTLKNSIATALAAMSSIGSAVVDAGTTSNALVTGASSPFTITLQDELANVKIPASAITATVVTSTAGTISMTKATSGNGAWTWAFPFGQVGKRFIALYEFDGLSYWKYFNCAINSWEMSFGLDDFIRFNAKGVCIFPVHIGTSLPANLGAYVDHSYSNNPPDSTTMTITHNGGAYTLAKGGKIAGSAQRINQHAIGANSGDAANITDGKNKAAFDLMARYEGYSGSVLEKYVTNADPTSFIITASSPTTIGVSGGTTPQMVWQGLNPKFVQGEKDAMQPETTLNMNGKLLYDATDTTFLKVTLRNEVARYDDRT